MGSEASVPAVPAKDTEVLMVHPRIETHGIKETTSGFIFFLINIQTNCALGTILFAFWSSSSFAIWGTDSSVTLERKTKVQHRHPCA
jgi:hypothetical protein